MIWRSTFDELTAQISGYPGLFGVCALAGLLVPVPEDVVLLYAGIRIDHGHFSWIPTLLATCSGVLLRDVIVYWIGRTVGDWLLARPWLPRLVGPKKLARSLRLVEEHGTGAVVVGRLLVGMRTPVFLVAGASGVGFRKFVAVDALGIVVTVPFFVLLGFWFGTPIVEWLFTALQSARALVVVAVVLGLAGWAGLTLRARRA